MKKVLMIALMITMALTITSNAFAVTTFASWYWGDTIQTNPVDYTYTADPSESVLLPVVFNFNPLVESVQICSTGFNVLYTGTGSGTWELVTSASTVSSGPNTLFQIVGGGGTLPEGLFTPDEDNPLYFNVVYFGGFLMPASALNSFSITVAEQGGNPVPEPATMILLGSGLIGLFASKRRKA
ncbi:MAG: PEP-CTERM sorting domain-containing protein [Candidatus Omnitrophica bacterium]|nr:PEP-CTERM sorting domain-containing protein [Candidatus Omnitrophota bacterium]